MSSWSSTTLMPVKNSAANEEGGEGGASHWNAIIAEADSRDRLEARVVWHGVLEKNSGNMLQGFHERHFLLTSHELTYWKKNEKAGKRNSSPPPDAGHDHDALNLEAVLLQAHAEQRDTLGRLSETPARASFSEASDALHKDGYTLKGTILFESIRGCNKNERDLELETMERSYELRGPTPEAADFFQAGLSEAAVERARVLSKAARRLEREKAELEREKASELAAMAAEVESRGREASAARLAREQTEVELESLKHDLASMAKKEAAERVEMEARVNEANKAMEDAIAHAAEVEALALESEKRAELHRAELFSALNAQLKAVIARQNVNAALLESIDSKMSELTNALNKLMRVTTFLAEGETEYPTLVMITPARQKGGEVSLSERLASAFSVDAWMSDEVHVYFLDALDYRPLDPPLVLKDAKPWVRKAAPALLVTFYVLKLAVAAGKIITGLPIPLDGLDDTINSVTDALDMNHVKKSTGLDVEGLAKQPKLGGKMRELVAKAVEEPSAEDEGSQKQQKEAQDELQPLAGLSYRLIAEEAAKQRILQRLPAKRCIDGDGTVAWVHEENVERWRQRSGVGAVEMTPSASKYEKYLAREAELQSKLDSQILVSSELVREKTSLEARVAKITSNKQQLEQTLEAELVHEAELEHDLKVHGQHEAKHLYSHVQENETLRRQVMSLKKQLLALTEAQSDHNDITRRLSREVATLRASLFETTAQISPTDLVGKHVHVEDLGAGTVSAFKKVKLSVLYDSMHTIGLDAGGEVDVLLLRKKFGYSNGGRRFALLG